MIEEYFRFIAENSDASVNIKRLRHQLVDIENTFGYDNLVKNRNTLTDCFADLNRPEEMNRSEQISILQANFKRAQEAARVIEEYAKLSDAVTSSEKAKRLRFALYSLEQQIQIG